MQIAEEVLNMTQGNAKLFMDGMLLERSTSAHAQHVNPRLSENMMRCMLQKMLGGPSRTLQGRLAPNEDILHDRAPEGAMVLYALFHVHAAGLHRSGLYFSHLANWDSGSAFLGPPAPVT